MYVVDMNSVLNIYYYMLNQFQRYGCHWIDMDGVLRRCTCKMNLSVDMDGVLNSMLVI